jgi:hypothetical protein
LLRRALLLLAIGTCLQLPAAPLSVILARRDLLNNAVQPGALQLVAACLVLAELLRMASSGRELFAAAAALSGAGVALLAPWVWGLELSSRYVLGSWLDGHAGAQFPSTPWLSFFLFGAAISAGWGTRLWREPWRMTLLAALGLGASALCYWQFRSGQRLTALYGPHPFWFTNPMFVVFRVGLVLAWLGVLSAGSGWLARSFAAWPGLGRVLAALSRHSLVAYVVHLSVLYGLPLRSGPGSHYSLLECSIACVAVLCISVLSVLHWERVRAWLMRGLRWTAAWLSAQPPARGAAPRDPLV